MNYNDEVLKKLQSIELDILKEIIRICKKNQIRYFTVGGTTLGAVRHNGFIPWDDDIDVGMIREDYERFIQIAPENLTDGYTLTHFTYDSNTPTYYAKLKKDGTRFVEKSTKNINMHHGVFVDIMPYDSIPENEKEREKYFRKVKLWNQLYIAKSIWISSFAPSKHKTIINCVRSILHILMIPIPKKYLFKKTDEAMRSYNGSDSKMISSRGLKAFNCELNDIFPTKEHDFCGMKVQIPSNYDKVLRTQYGDYMKLPPEDKRYSHAPIILEI